MEHEPDAAERLIEWTGERCVPWTGDLQVVYEHYHRYLLAQRLVVGKRVLDLASGEGYGAALMAQVATHVTGLELDPASVAHSRKTYPRDGLEFVEGTMLDLSAFPAGSIDVVTCFEALEHVAEHDELVEGVLRVLAPGGLFLTSTPDRLVYSGELHQHNPFHVRELSLDEFRTLLNSHFAHTAVWGQAVAVGSLMRAVDGRGEMPELLPIANEGDGWGRRAEYPATYYVAVASKESLPELPTQSLLVDVDLELIRSPQREAHRTRDQSERAIGVLREEISAARGSESAVRQVADRLATEAATLKVELAQHQSQLASAQRAERRLRAEAASAGAERDAIASRVEAVRARLDDMTEERDDARRELAVITGSRFHRLVQRYYRTIDAVAPAGTRRRALYSSSIRAAVRGIRAVRPLPPSVPDEAPSVPRLPMSVGRGEPGEVPVVSVIIPIHGKWAVTAQCLLSFFEHPPTVPYEIVVVDDASPDDSRARLSEVPGIIVVPLDVNVGFVGAVNAGIAACRGEYVVMLNNDTQVTDGWLEALLSVAQEPDVGLVGSKLVYPDGRLQEAGGIIFQNGHGWNFGRFDDPTRERYNVRRDVDYCSGAAIMVRRQLLHEIGGLDDYFAPAYYDDVDLAFTIRERGLRVVYEPRAVVVHHEGVSHGTDEGSGVKAFQEVNRHKLVAKWGHHLESHYPQSQDHVPCAARRWDGKGTIIVVDHHVPRPDEDSGSVRMFALLTTLRHLGWSVIFVPDNRDHGGVWGDRLLAAGVEVFCGPEPIDQFLVSVRDRVRLVIGARVGVAWPYLSLLRRVLPLVPFVFDTVDLHHLREQREAELSGIPEAFMRAEETRALELGLITAADATLVVSPFEVDLLAREAPDAKVFVVPNVHAQREQGPGPAGREGMLFVGGFAHPPNADAVRWFVSEILPIVRASAPDAVLRVVGKGLPPEMAALDVDGVEFLGWVPDLDELYKSSRIAIAPLRYGAGIKGKVGEALSYGTPVVATSVAAEGMGIAHGIHGAVADDPAEFASAIVALLSDDDLWQRLAAGGRDLVERELGVASFAQKIGSALDEVVMRARSDGGATALEGPECTLADSVG